MLHRRSALLIGGLVPLLLALSYYLGTRLAPSPPPTAPAALQPLGGPIGERVQARVVAVADGDTIRLENGDRVRYLGLDTPERGDDKTPRQAFGAEAAGRNQQLVQGKTVRLEPDAEDRDRFGRLLRHVWVGDELVAAALLRAGLGYAQLIPPNAKHRARLEAAQAEAQAERRGLWGGWPTPAPIFLTPVRPALLPLANPRPPSCPPELVPAEQAGSLVGEAAALCLRDIRVRRGTDAAYLRARDATPTSFTIVLFRSVWADLPDDLERYFDHRTVAARGRIELYDGAPELVLRDARDLQVVP